MEETKEITGKWFSVKIWGSRENPSIILNPGLDDSAIWLPANFDEAAATLKEAVDFLKEVANRPEPHTRKHRGYK